MTYLVDLIKNGPLVMIPASVKDTSDVPFGFPSLDAQEGFHLSGDTQLPAARLVGVIYDGPEERFDAIAISASDKELRSLVPEHKGKFAPQILGKAHAMVDVEGQKQLTVAGASESIGKVREGEKMAADIVVVVEFAIDDTMEGTIRRMKRLGTLGAQVVNGKADVAKCCCGRLGSVGGVVGVRGREE